MNTTKEISRNVRQINPNIVLSTDQAISLGSLSKGEAINLLIQLIRSKAEEDSFYHHDLITLANILDDNNKFANAGEIWSKSEIDTLRAEISAFYEIAGYLHKRSPSAIKAFLNRRF